MFLNKWGFGGVAVALSNLPLEKMVYIPFLFQNAVDEG